MKLRPYQSDAVDAVFVQWEDRPTTLLVMPTGCGKTVVFSHVIERFPPCRVMVLAHREELIRQAADKIEAVTGQHCDIEMAGQWADTNMFNRSRVVVSSIQTQIAGHNGKGRMTRFRPEQFGLVIVDEAHHAVAPTYRRVLDHYRRNPDCKVLGVTATPDRTDETALAAMFESCAYEYGILDAIHDGWLVDIYQHCVKVEGLDYSSIRTTAGDLNGADLAAVMEYEENLHRIAHPTLDIVAGRRALVFAASVAHAERLAEILNRHRDGCCEWICGETEKDRRAQVLRDFSVGHIQIVVNVGVLTEGYDEPGVEVVVMARPTKSRSLYAQMIGRGTRPLPGIVDGLEEAADRKEAIRTSAKPRLEVIDFVGNAGRHKLVNAADVLGGKLPEEIVEQAREEAGRAGRPVDMASLLDEAVRQMHEERERQRQAERDQRRRLVARATYRTYDVDPFDVLHIEPVQVRAWDTDKQPTEKQVAFLERSGVDVSRLNHKQASQIIGELMDRHRSGKCSFKQARLLEQFGFSSDVSRQEASRVIDQIKAQGWRKPQLEEITAW